MTILYQAAGSVAERQGGFESGQDSGNRYQLRQGKNTRQVRQEIFRDFPRLVRSGQQSHQGLQNLQPSRNQTSLYQRGAVSGDFRPG